MESPTNIEICVLSRDEKLASQLEELLDGFDLGVDFLSSTWEDFSAYLEVPAPGTRVICLMSLGDLCEGGFDVLTRADEFMQARPTFSPVLIVEPWVLGELDSVRLVTGFQRTILLLELAESLGGLLMGLIPGLAPAPMSRSANVAPPPDPAPPAASGGEEVHVVVVGLDGVGKGDLSTVWLSRLLYSLYVRAFTGTLKLRTGQREQIFTFKSGQAGAVHGEGPENLLSAFAWDKGQCEVAEGPVPSTFTPFAPMLRLIYEGVLRHLSLNRAAERLTGFEGKYPVSTEFFGDRKNELASLTTLVRFCQNCKGSKTWSQIISVTWDDIQEALKVACYALDTDLVVMADAPMDRPATVKYSTRSTFNVRQSLSLSTSSVKAKAEGPDQEAIKALVSKLRERLDFYGSTDAYELFGLHPECGAAMVRDRYYKMVKDHHPDVVGGNISPEVKALAELLFIHVKDAYVELLSLEKDSTGGQAAKDGPSERHTSSVRRSAPSGARKAAEAQVARLTNSRSIKTSPNSRPAATSENSEREKPARRPSGDAPIRKKTSSGFRKPTTGDQPVPTVKPADLPPGPRRRTTDTARATSVPLPSGYKTQPPAAQPPVAHPAPATAPTGEQRKNLQERINQNIPPDVHFKNGEKLMKTGQYDKAREAFKQATRLERENPVYRAHYAWATLMVTPSEVNRVKEILQECLKMSGRAVEANLFLARIYKRDGEINRAIKFYEAAVAEDRSCVEAQRELRLHSMRKESAPEEDTKERAESFFGKLFQKKK